MAVPTSYLYPYGSPAVGSGAFPDNDLKPMEYDSRVTSNDMLRIGAKLMHQAPAYVREENLLGEGVYTWEPDFILMIQESFANGIKSNFSKDQKGLFDEYLVYLANGLTPTTSEAVKALDQHMTGLV